MSIKIKDIDEKNLLRLVGSDTFNGFTAREKVKSIKECLNLVSIEPLDSVEKTLRKIKNRLEHNVSISEILVFFRELYSIIERIEYRTKAQRTNKKNN